jgi:hypothetical protein
VYGDASRQFSVVRDFHGRTRGRVRSILHARQLPASLAGVPLLVNRAPVLTLWAAVVAERLGHPADTALTLGRAVAGSSARIKARSIGREERKTDRDADTPRLAVQHVTAPVFLLGKTIRLLPTADHRPPPTCPWWRLAASPDGR